MDVIEGQVYKMKLTKEKFLAPNAQGKPGTLFLIETLSSTCLLMGNLQENTFTMKKLFAT
jgi:hypothetical protein